MVTGGSSGLGDTARSLAAAGAEITLAVRDPEAGARVADDITIATGNDHLHVALWTSPIATQSDFSSATGKGLWTSWLVNNAGVILPTLERTAEGWEKQFAVNHLGHLLFRPGCMTHSQLLASQLERYPPTRFLPKAKRSPNSGLG